MKSCAQNALALNPGFWAQGKRFWVLGFPSPEILIQSDVRDDTYHDPHCSIAKGAGDKYISDESTKWALLLNSGFAPQGKRLWTLIFPLTLNFDLDWWT